MSSPYSRPRLNDRRPAAAAPSGAAAPAPAGRTVADALADANPAASAHVVRIRYRLDQRTLGYHTLTAYSADGRQLWLAADHDADRLRRAALIAYIRGAYPHVDWRKDHDIHLNSGRVYSSPLPEEDGYLPDVDGGVFGGGPAVLLADAEPTPAPVAAGAAA